MLFGFMGRGALLLGLAFLAVGCARYEFDLVEPSNSAQHITEKVDTVVHRDAVEYRLQAYEGRLVIQAQNLTDEPIELVGSESYVVDPANQSRPLSSQTVAPHSFTKIILPPLRPFYKTEPGIGIGLEVSRGLPDRQPRIVDDEPRYVAVQQDAQGYWTWDGESSIRLRFTWRVAQKVVHDDFTVKRRKM